MNPVPSPTQDNTSIATGIDLSLVQRLFALPSRVAATDFLRREISARMQERLDLIKISPKVLLDAGCGEGADLRALRQRYPDAHLAGVDASDAMLAAASAGRQAGLTVLRRLFGNWLGADSLRLLCSDFANMPLPDNDVDLLWSNLALHWHPQPQSVFAEWRRVLRVNGLLMFSCFGPDTLKEIRQAFLAIDDFPHVLPFFDMHDLGDMLLATGFSTPVMDMERITVTYESATELIADVRAFGGNPLSARRRGLLGRKGGERVMLALEALRGSGGKIPLTFEVVYGHAFKPAPTTTSQGEAIVRFVNR